MHYLCERIAFRVLLFTSRCRAWAGLIQNSPLVVRDFKPKGNGVIHAPGGSYETEKRAENPSIPKYSSYDSRFQKPVNHNPNLAVDRLLVRLAR